MTKKQKEAENGNNSSEDDQRKEGGDSEGSKADKDVSESRSPNKDSGESRSKRKRRKKKRRKSKSVREKKGRRKRKRSSTNPDKTERDQSPANDLKTASMDVSDFTDDEGEQNAERRVSKILIMTDGIKIVHLDSTISSEEQDNWNRVKSLGQSEDNSQSLESPAHVTSDNSFRDTSLEKPQQIQIITGHVSAGWLRPIYRFYVNRLFETPRVIRRNIISRMFPNVRNLMLEVMHFPLTERADEDSVNCYAIATAPLLPAMALDQEKEAVLVESTRFVALILRTFSNIIDLYIKKQKRGGKQTANSLITELLCTMKDIPLGVSDADSARPWSGIRVEEVGAELEKLINMVDVINRFKLLTVKGDTPATEATDSILESSGDLWSRVVSSYHKTRCHVASILLRLPTTCLADVDKKSSFNVEPVKPGDLAFRIPIGSINEVHTSGAEAGTKSMFIEVKRWNLMSNIKNQKNTLLTYTGEKLQPPKEVLVHETKNTKNVFYVHNEDGVATVQFSTCRPFERSEMDKLKTAEVENAESEVKTASDLDTAYLDDENVYASPVDNNNPDENALPEAGRSLKPKIEQITESSSIPSSEIASTVNSVQKRSQCSANADAKSEKDILTEKVLFPRHSAFGVTEKMATALRAPKTNFERDERISLKNVYVWAKETQQQYEEAMKSKPTEKTDRMREFLSKQGHAKNRFWMDPSESEQHLVPLAKEPRPADQWDALVAGWSHSTRMRWKIKGMHVDGQTKLDQPATADKKPVQAPADEQTSFYQWVRQVVKKTLGK